MLVTMDDEALTRRAFAAYFRSGGEYALRPANTSGVVEHKGKWYVELHNCTGTLAVYRIRNGGFLKRLRRWPKAVEAGRRVGIEPRYWPGQ
jgi:hypothetical protein